MNSSSCFLATNDNLSWSCCGVTSAWWHDGHIGLGAYVNACYSDRWLLLQLVYASVHLQSQIFGRGFQCTSYLCMFSIRHVFAYHHNHKCMWLLIFHTLWVMERLWYPKVDVQGYATLAIQWVPLRNNIKGYINSLTIYRWLATGAILLLQFSG